MVGTGPVVQQVSVWDAGGAADQAGDADRDDDHRGGLLRRHPDRLVYADVVHPVARVEHDRVEHAERGHGHQQRRNWAFDGLLAAVFIVSALSGTDITGHLLDTTNNTPIVHYVPVPPAPGRPAAPPAPVNAGPDAPQRVFPADPFDVRGLNGPQGPGWIAVAAILTPS
jgi:hypothetical protein